MENNCQSNIWRSDNIKFKNSFYIFLKLSIMMLLFVFFFKRKNKGVKIEVNLNFLIDMQKFFVSKVI
jgi:hypothetical protein